MFLHPRAFEIDCEIDYQVFAPSTLVFKIEAAFCVEQSIGDETLTTTPPVPIGRYTDPLGNRTLRMNVAPGPFGVRYRTTAIVRRIPGEEHLRETPIAQLPLDVLPYLTGSRYVESELIFHDAVRWIGAAETGWRRVQRICEWVRANVKYEIGSSKPYGTARDVLSSRTGVCRDYAHVAIGLCRALNIPARFVVGHVPWDTPPPDFHALFEAWLDGRWVMFDPTDMADPLDVVRIGTGQDAADLPFATLFGQAQLTRLSPVARAVVQEPAPAEAAPPPAAAAPAPAAPGGAAASPGTAEPGRMPS